MKDSTFLFNRLITKPNNLRISKKFALATVHRAENTNDITRLKAIFKALNNIGKR